MKLLKDRELLLHQKVGVKFILKNKHTLLSYATGTGKTTILLATAQYLLFKSLVDIVVIVTTAKGIIPVEKELKELVGTYERISKKDTKYLDRLSNYSGIILVKYSEVETVTNYLLKYQKCFAVFFDEVHTIKNPLTKVSKKSKVLNRLALYSCGCSGTLLTKDIEDLYNLVNFFNPYLLGTYENFLDNYTAYYKIPLMTKTGYQFNKYKPIKFKNLSTLNSTLSNTVITYSPNYDIQYHKELIKLSDRTEYNRILQEVIDSKDETLIGDHPPEALIHLQRYLNMRKEKINKLLEVIQRYIQEGLIVFCNNYDELDFVKSSLDKLNILNDTYTGKLNEKRAIDTADWFTSDPHNKVLLITQAGGQSINLQVVNKLIFYSLPFSIGKYKQIIGRISRQDSKYSKFDVYMILTDDTIETYKLTYLGMFGEIYNVVFNDFSVNRSSNIPAMNRWLLKQIASKTIWN